MATDESTTDDTSTGDDTAPEADPELEAMQEKALQLEVDIYEPGDNGGELDLETLTAAVQAKTDDLLKESADEEAEAEAARKSAKKVEADEKKANAKAAKDAAKAQAKIDKAAAKTPKAATPEHGLGKASAADTALAERHGYPTIIPGAKAYRVVNSMHCSFGGGLRPVGGIILLTDAHAANKGPSIKPIK